MTEAWNQRREDQGSQARMSLIAHRTLIQMLVTGQKMLMREIGGNYLLFIVTCLPISRVEENSDGLDLWSGKF